MPEIPLTKGYVAVVDQEDYEPLATARWSAKKTRRGCVYAVRTIHVRGVGDRRLYMHRAILCAPVGADVDHKDGNGLNNRRGNLRVCSRSANLANQRKQSRQTSRFKGVWWNVKKKHWRCGIKLHGRSQHIGCFSSDVDAAHAYDAKARELFGEFAAVNFPGPGERGCLSEPLQGS
jgi:hypothetical protein